MILRCIHFSIKEGISPKNVVIGIMFNVTLVLNKCSDNIQYKQVRFHTCITTDTDLIDMIWTIDYLKFETTYLSFKTFP